MPRKAKQTPFDLLLDIDSRAKQLSRNYPVENENREVWSGIGFRIGKQELLVPVEEVVEIVTLSSLTRVPGVRFWVRGITNVRGTLVPVLDIQRYLYGQQAHPADDARSDFRVIIVNFSGHPAGLQVSAVMGIKHFWTDERIEEIPELDEILKPYVSSAFRRDEELWGVFDIPRLLQNESFSDVAA